MYIYNDEDNVPMEDPWMKNTTYSCKAEYEADMRGELEKEEAPKGCWNCIHYDTRHEACSLDWNNADDSYYNPDTDDRYPADCCEDHETDPDARWEDWFEEE